VFIIFISTVQFLVAYTGDDFEVHDFPFSSSNKKSIDWDKVGLGEMPFSRDQNNARLQDACMHVYCNVMR